MPIIDTPAGTLEVTNAILSASEFRATQKISVSNSAPTKNFSVGDRFHIDKDSVDPVSVTGNVVASGIKISNLTISPTFDLAAVSNVGNTTSNTLQFANATTSFVASSNVEIGGNITLTSNAQVKVGSNVLAEYTGPHGRDPTTPLLKKYPEIAFDASKFDKNDTTNTYTQAGYTVTDSSHHSEYYGAWIFDDQTGFVTDKNLWISPINTYTTSGGAGTPTMTTSDSRCTTVSGVATPGEWVQIKLPNKVKLSSISVMGPTGNGGTGSQDLGRAPKDAVLAGSVDGTTWNSVLTWSGAQPYLLKTYKSFPANVDSTNYYNYFRLIVTKNDGTHVYASIQEIKYYGYEEPAPPGDLSLDTTLKSTFNSVRSNNYVMYFDGEDPAAGNVPKYLVSGSAKSITPNNVVFDATNNCWTLDGSTESNVTTGSLGFEGDVPHTVSTWINASNLEANALTQQLFSIGSGYDKAFLKVDDTQIAANTWHNVTYAYQGEGGSKVTYVDGRKVEEAQVEDTFGDYPPFAMTDYKTGGYCVSASSEISNYPAWEAFDDDVTDITNCWHTPNPLYDANNGGLYNGTVRLASNTNLGEWLKIEMPHRLVVSYVTIHARGSGGTYEGQAPEDFQICGSNDNVNWDVIASFTGESPQDDGTSNYVVNSTKGYNYHAIVSSRSVADNSTAVVIQNVKFYGHKEGDLTRFPEPTRVLKYPHISIPSSYAKRGYVVSASSDQYKYGANNIESRGAWAAFGNTGSEPGWQLYYNGASNAPYASSADGSGFYQNNALASTLTGTSHRGEWIKLELPHKLMVQKMKTDHGSEPERLGQVILLGSNNDSDWYTIKDTFALTNASAQTTDINATVAYKYIVLIVKSLQNASLNVDLKNLEYYGTQEDTGTPAIVGGPFAGKVANFRVYDQYLGDERIQEIYDAQKDEFGHKKSSMTFYKGRVGVGTTEPEGALTVIDEPHALVKFPARAVSADDSYVEGDGQIKLSAADGSGYQAFDGLTSTSWTATPTRHTRVSEEVDFGAWLKIQTPESVSLKKAEIESKPDWNQVGGEVQGSLANGHFGRSVACSHDGTRVIAGGYTHNSNQGIAKVYDWNGTAWTQVGQNLTGVADGNAPQFSRNVAISGDGNIIAVTAPYEHVGGDADKGTVRVYYLNGGQWTILPDSGSLTDASLTDVFVGTAVNVSLGLGSLQLSYDGKTIAMTEYGYDITGKSDVGRVLVYKYSNGAWSYKGTGASQFVGDTADAHFGFGMSMSEDGDHLALGTVDGGHFVEVYKWDATSSTWGIKDARINQPSTSGTTNDYFGQVVSISNDGNTLAVGMKDADLADGALVDNGGLVLVYHWTGSAWGTPHKLQYDEATDEEFGLGVVLSGDGKRMLVTAGAENNYASEIFTFEYTGTSWVMRTPGVQGLNGYTPDGHLGWGWVHGGHPFTISRDGSTIVAGELGYDTPATNAGRFRVFSMPSNIESIWGSNDDVNWTKITTAPTREEATSNVAGLAFGYDDRLEFKNLDNPNYYKYHAIVADAFTQLKDIKLFGVRNQGSSTLHDGALTLTKNLDVPRIGPPLDADDTPRRDRLVVEYNTSTNPVEDGVVRDTSGRGNDACMKGATSYSSAMKAFDIAGTPDGSSAPTTSAYLEVGQRLPFTGNQAHTASLWFKKNNVGSDYTLVNMWKEGTNYGTVGDTSGFMVLSTGKLQYWHFGGDLIYTDPVGDTSYGGWRHVVAVYTGQTVGDQKLYINGIEAVVSSSTGLTNTIDITNAKMTVGQDYFRGNYYNQANTEFSGIKVYDTALTAQEVKTLYDMGRCDEGHHMVNFSKTRVGIGLGDGEAAQAALDVRGSLRIPTTNDGITNGLIKINPDNLELEFCTTLHDSSQAQPATGGTLSYPSGDTTLHKFVSSGSFTVTTGPLLVEYIILAGGGSGGYNHGGGGGGGGYCRGVTKVSVGTHNIIVGAGGAAGASAQIGSNGGDSHAFGITAKGGGYGGARGANNSSSLPSERGNSGGSGGGGAGTATVYGSSGGTITLGGSNIMYADEWRSVRNDHSIQGHKGGIGSSSANTTNAGNGGGGGGAGAAGGNATGGSTGDGSSGAGGSGLYDDFEINSTAGTPAVQPSASGGGGMTGRGGGGSGGRWAQGTIGYPADNTSAFGGGAGGGQNNLGQTAHAGVDQKGGGGGGGPDGGGVAGNGGDGIVMIRYFRPVVRTGAGNP